MLYVKSYLNTHFELLFITEEPKNDEQSLLDKKMSVNLGLTISKYLISFLNHG